MTYQHTYQGTCQPAITDGCREEPKKNFRVRYYSPEPAPVVVFRFKSGRFQALRRLLRQFRSMDPRISSGGVISMTEPRRSPCTGM